MVTSAVSVSPLAPYLQEWTPWHWLFFGHHREEASPIDQNLCPIAHEVEKSGSLVRMRTNALYYVLYTYNFSSMIHDPKLINWTFEPHGMSALS